MSWMSALIETYDNYYSGDVKNNKNPLLPIGFIEKKIGIQVYLNSDGSFDSAHIPENDWLIAVPSSPEAEGKTGDSAIPYPLYDEIRYVSGDLSQFTQKDYSRYYQAYHDKLEQWQNAEHAPIELQILFSYIEKSTLISDILSSKVVSLDKNGEFPEKLLKNFVEFLIYSKEEHRFVSIAELDTVRLSWQKQLPSSMTEYNLSYASGISEPVLCNHAKIEGNAKLISAKDSSRIFQYKGRFQSAEEACMVGYESSAKIHNTLKWLRKNQGFTQYGMTFLSWNTECRKIIRLDEEFDDFCEETAEIDTEAFFSKSLNNSMNGLSDTPEYRKDSHIVLLGMEAATPGRMSVNFYEELDGSEYLRRLHHWYQNCYFRLYRFEKESGKLSIRIATPNLYEIGCAVFGDENMRAASGDKKTEKSITKQVKTFYLDIFSCICGKKKIPYPYVQAAYHRVMNPLRYVQKQTWSRLLWERSLSVTLAMLKNRKNKEEEYQVSLNYEETDRSYLFGRLTAIADVIEYKAMNNENDRQKDRQTNAVRYFTAMQQRPAVTWANLRSRLEPYFGKIRSPYLREFYRKMIDEVYCIGADGSLADNTPLSPRFLEGYHNQRYELMNTKKKEN